MIFIKLLEKKKNILFLKGIIEKKWSNKISKKIKNAEYYLFDANSNLSSLDFKDILFKFYPLAVYSELMNLKGTSISAPHFNRKRANYYVNKFAGGFNKKNSKSNTVVVYPNGIAKNISH